MGCRYYQALHCRHKERNGVSIHQPHDCLLNRFMHRSKEKKQGSASLAFVRGIQR